MELRRLRRAARRQHNKDCCGEFDLEYPRLFAEFQSLRNRLGRLGEIVQSTLPEPLIAASQAMEAIQNNRDDEAAKAYGRTVASAREEIEIARHRVAARLVELRERHRIVGSELDRFRLEHESLLATLQNFASDQKRQGINVAATSQSEQEAEHLLQVTCPTSIAWAGVAVDDAAALARAETLLGTLREALRKGRAQFEGLVQHSLETSAGEHTSTPRPLSFSEYWAKREPVVPASKPAGTDPARFSMASFDPLLKQAAALPTADLYLAFCAQVREIESVADPEARRVRGEVLMIQGIQQIRERRGLFRFRAEVQSMLDQVAPFQELAMDPLTDELKGLLSGVALSDLGPLRKRHAETLDRARARREREAKRLALLDARRELGYQASENMETAFTDSGRLLVHKGDEKEYAIEIVADASLDRVQTAMLRYSGSLEMSEQQRLRDREREAAWCGDHGKLRQIMERRGWESDLTMQRPPGEHPVRVVADPARVRRHEPPRGNVAAEQDSKR